MKNFGGSFWSNIQQNIKHVFIGVMDTIEGIFLIILSWHTKSIPFTHVISCDRSHENQRTFSPVSRIHWKNFPENYNHILFIQ
jgi:hypothetical protein